MQRSYKNNNSGTRSHMLRVATAAVITILVLIVVCIVELIVLAVLNAKLRAQEDINPNGTNTALTTANDTTAPDNSQSTNYNAAFLDLTEDFGQDYIDKIIFVGDSTTYGMRSRAYHVLTGGTDTKQVWVPVDKDSQGNETPTLSLDIDITNKTIVYPRTGNEMTIAAAAGVEKPEYMVITLGINNGVPFLSEAEFKQCYRKLLDAITTATPGTKIMLQSIYPVASNNTKSTLTNEKIDAANFWVADLALEYNLKYLNTNTDLKDEQGYLKTTYQNGDGIHLNREGFEAVLYYIRTHGCSA